MIQLRDSFACVPILLQKPLGGYIVAAKVENEHEDNEKANREAQ
jgi:hypothetical protein